jgi:hypothetical protein
LERDQGARSSFRINALVSFVAKLVRERESLFEMPDELPAFIC